jgi:uncharacterized protein (TIGR03435 family)
MRFARSEGCCRQKRPRAIRRSCSRGIGTIIVTERSHAAAEERLKSGHAGKNLSGQLGRPVIERTGLTGLFDLTLEWMPPSEN